MSNQETEFSANMDAGEEALQPFDVRDSSGRQGLVKLLVGFGVLLVAALIVLKLYQPGVRDRDDPPRITADNTPFKVPPAEPGGAQTPDQDKNVFDVMDGQTPDETVVTAPTPEVPIKVPETANIQVQEPTVKPKPTPKTPVVKAPDPIDRGVTDNVKSAPDPKLDRDTRTVASGNSEYVVQVASVRSQDEAGQVWSNIRRKYPNIVTEAFYADVRRVDLAEKGIYYRTRLAGLADKQAATDMCNKLKAAGQACFVARK